MVENTAKLVSEMRIIHNAASEPDPQPDPFRQTWIQESERQGMALERLIGQEAESRSRSLGQQFKQLLQEEGVQVQDQAVQEPESAGQATVELNAAWQAKMQAMEKAFQAECNRLNEALSRKKEGSDATEQPVEETFESTEALDRDGLVEALSRDEPPPPATGSPAVRDLLPRTATAVEVSPGTARGMCRPSEDQRNTEDPRPGLLARLWKYLNQPAIEIPSKRA